MAWKKLCAVEALGVGTGRCFEVDGQKIALFHTDEGFHAIDDHCPHRSGPLSEGNLSGTEISCPWHQWVFNLKDGVCRTIPGQRVAIYQVREHAGQVEIEISAK